MNWISGFALLLLVTGLVVGLCVAGTDLLNPTTSQAEAERITAETRHLDVMNQLEEQRAAAQTEQEVARIRHEMELEEARYQAELARIAADQAYYERMLNIQANATERLWTALIVVGGLGGVSLIVIGTKVALVRLPAPAPTQPAATAQQPDDEANRSSHRHSPNGYELERINARQRELLELAITQRRVRAACNKRMTSDEYQNLPLAG
ncbi:MAG: hypothetical protein ABWK53_12270 [Anaerolineales bacterium]